MRSQKRNEKKKPSTLESLKLYFNLTVLWVIYYLSKYGFKFNLKEIEFKDYLTITLFFFGFVLQLAIAVVKKVINWSLDNFFKMLNRKREFSTGKSVSSNLSKLLKSQKITREELLEFKSLINELLPKSQINRYESYEFENDAHEIYVKIKNQYLTEYELYFLNNHLKKLSFKNSSTKKPTTA